MAAKTNQNLLYCSFCGKSQDEVASLIAGPTALICDECVDICAKIAKERKLAKAIAEAVNPPVPGLGAK